MNAEEKEMIEFSWTGMFAVTGFCFFLFSLFMKVIDGSNGSLFFFVGLISMGFALVSYLNKWMTKKERNEKTEEISTIFED
jgi:Na+/melibiose symporter-like transporter